MNTYNYFKKLPLLLLLIITPFCVFSQTRTISGKITDLNNETLIGVNVIEKGTTNGSVTDIDGHFSVNVPSNSTLLISYVGYISQEIPIEGKTSFNIVLVEDYEILDELVVVGYGTQRKEAVTGSVTSMKGDAMREVASSNITQALQGRVAGVEMSQTSTKPGSQMQIRIRGTRSLNASNDPLIVLNGIPFAGSIGDINPNDIQGLDILKDASATAIYGSRGANGVIIITTNTGQRGQKARVSYNGYYGVKDVFAKYPMMNANEFIDLRATAGQFTNGVDESDDINTDWQDLFYKTGMITSHDVGVTGGTETGSYNFGAGFYQDKAVMPGQ
ncbi:MAG: TonB-dependent receptor plug domain-containing protein, partial [Bacteroidales bacterium]|nr:TonB-dependent receptor plug domain-containing protein [Bacteroidales bacterium]